MKIMVRLFWRGYSEPGGVRRRASEPRRPSRGSIPRGVPGQRQHRRHRTQRVRRVCRLDCRQRGLAATENSYFFKKHGFKVEIKAERGGKLVGALELRQDGPRRRRRWTCWRFTGAIPGGVPALIGYSRGADGLVAQRDQEDQPNCAAQIVVTAQFTEADFFIRYLAFEAGLAVNLLPNPDSNRPGQSQPGVFLFGFAAGECSLPT